MKLCASFQNHWWIQNGVTVRKRSIRIKIGDFFVSCDFEFWRITLKNKRAPLLYYVKHCTSFQAMGEFKLELQSGNAQFASKSVISCPVWPSIWRMTLKNNRTPLRCCFKLCASFGSHWWIQTGVTVRKCLIWVKNDDFFSCVTLKFDGWPWKFIGHLP